MGFFNRKQKKIALKHSNFVLEKLYHISEQKLHYASLSGNEKQLKKAMKQHGNFEYALLYKNTPEYKKLVRKNLRRNNGK